MSGPVEPAANVLAAGEEDDVFTCASSYAPDRHSVKAEGMQKGRERQEKSDERKWRSTGLKRAPEKGLRGQNLRDWEKAQAHHDRAVEGRGCPSRATKAAASGLGMRLGQRKPVEPWSRPSRPGRVMVPAQPNVDRTIAYLQSGGEVNPGPQVKKKVTQPGRTKPWIVDEQARSWMECKHCQGVRGRVRLAAADVTEYEGASYCRLCGAPVLRMTPHLVHYSLAVHSIFEDCAPYLSIPKSALGPAATEPVSQAPNTASAHAALSSSAPCLGSAAVPAAAAPAAVPASGAGEKGEVIVVVQPASAGAPQAPAKVATASAGSPPGPTGPVKPPGPSNPPPGGPPSPPPGEPKEPKPVPGVAALRDDLLDGRRLWQDPSSGHTEGQDFATFVGAKFVGMTDARLPYLRESRPAIHRNVRETAQDMAIQIMNVSELLHRWVIISVVAGLGLFACVMMWQLVTTLNVVRFLGVVSTLVAGVWSHDRDASYQRIFAVVALSAGVALSWGVPPTVGLMATYLAMCLGAMAGMWQIHRSRREVVLRSALLLCSVAFFQALMILSRADRLLGPLVFTAGVSGGLMLVVRLSLRAMPRRMRRIMWCPHAVTSCMLEYSNGTSAEVVKANTRLKLQRLATLPVPDKIAVDLMAGTEQVIYFLVPKEPFFAGGAAFVMLPL